MKSVSLGQVARATTGELEGPADLSISRVGVDSRAIRRDELFVALKGEHHDGHSFLKDVSHSGARAAVVERHNSLTVEFRRSNGKFPLVLVEDTLKALGDLASYVRERLDLTAVGITGTTGKTCTKDYLAAVLARKFKVAASPASYNNEIGLPLTIFQANGSHQVLICEMGARHPGDIHRLAVIAKPRLGIITNVGPGHLKLFEGQEQVARTKAELAAALPEDGTLFLNADNDWSDWISGQTGARVIKYGCGRYARYRGKDVTLDDGGCPRFQLRGPGFVQEIRLSSAGRHQVENALAAAACAHQMGLEPAEIAEGLAGAQLSPWRMEIRKVDDIVLINDAYNANPQSTRAALETVARLSGERRTIAVLGDMAELGEDSPRYHREIGEAFASLDLDILVAVGELAGGYASGALSAGLPRGSVFRCYTATEAQEILDVVLEPDDVVLIKASRVMGLEQLADELAANRS